MADTTRAGLPASLRHHAGFLTAALFALIWLVLAETWSDRHFHVMPFAVAASWAYARRAVVGDRLPSSVGLGCAAGGLAVALVTTFGLEITGPLGGATLWGGDEIVAESVVAAVLGAAWGWRVVTRSNRGLLLGRRDDEPPGRKARGDEVRAT